MQYQQYNTMQPTNPPSYQSHSFQMPHCTYRRYDAIPPSNHERYHSTQEYGVVSSPNGLLLSNNPFRQQSYQGHSSERPHHANQGYDVVSPSNDLIHHPNRCCDVGTTLNDMDHHGTQHYNAASPSNDLPSSENAFLQQATSWIPKTPRTPQGMLPVLQVSALPAV